MSQYMTYIIAQGDTLETISQSQLGADEVSQIVALNNLRYPYISNNPYDQYSQPKGIIQLLAPVGIGTSKIIFKNPNNTHVNLLNTLFFQDITAGTYEAIAVSGISTISNGNLAIDLQVPLQNWYTLSAIVTVFVNQQNVGTKVLKTGDTLFLPITIPNVFSLDQGNITDVYGTDIALDANNVITKANGDWATVTGLANLRQAIVNRWNTPVGGLPGEPTYGNRQHELIGEINQSYYLALAQTFATQSALSDPRVQAVNNLTITVAKDKSSIMAAITPVNSPQSFVLQANVSTGGGG